MDIQQLIRRRVKRVGSIRTLAAILDVDHAYLYRVMTGEREPGQQILDALGLQRIVTYRRKGS